jgi:hypothetical protein
MGVLSWFRNDCNSAPESKTRALAELGYLHQPLLLGGSATRKSYFEKFIESYQDSDLKLAITLFEDSGIGGYEDNFVRDQDYTNRKSVLRRVNRYSVSPIMQRVKLKKTGYTDEHAAMLRRITKRFRKDDAFYKSVVNEYMKFLESIVEDTMEIEEEFF